MSVGEIRSRADFKRTLARPAVVVEVYSQGCGDCSLVAPKVETLARKYKSVDFYQTDSALVGDVVLKYHVRYSPCFLFFKNGKLLAKKVTTSSKKLEKLVKKIS